MIIKGYAIIFSYIFALILLMGSVVKKITNTETSRKLIHIMLAFVWVFIDMFLKGTIHQIILPILFLVINALSYKFKLFASIEREEGNHLGTVYFAIAMVTILTISYWVPQLYLHSGVAVFCLTLGDGFAALVGYNVKSKKIYENKSLAGFLACFLFSMIGILIFKCIYLQQIPWMEVVLLAAVVAIMELFSYGIDNFTVTFVAFFLSYYMTEHGSKELFVSILLSVLVFLIVFMTKAIQFYGAVFSMVVVFLFSYVGGTVGIVYLLVLYFTIFLISKYKKRKKLANGEEAELKVGKSFWQIFINGIWGCVFLVLYAYINEKSLLVASFVCVGGCFVDSISSDIGVLSNGKVYDPIRRTIVKKGLSGGVSIVGTVAAFLASLLIAIYMVGTLSLSWLSGCVIWGMIFLQTIVDTILGSLLQVKYQCVSCKEITEEKWHCNTQTIYWSGVRMVDNNAVNLLASTCIAILMIGVSHVWIF
jgi:phytol kinase